MGTTARRVRGCPPLALTATLMLALLAALLLAGSALAAGHEGMGKGARPGKPTAAAPSGAIAVATPTFTWSTAKGATRYELRVYEGSTLLLTRAGLKQRAWTSTLALPANVDLTWKVRGSKAGRAGPWSASLAFTIVPPNPAKALTAFSFQGLTPPVVGTINEAAHTIALAVPFGTSRTALVATFTTSGASVAVAGTPQVSGVTANNFSNPVTYTVTAADGTTQTYVVTVTVASGPGPSPAKALTAFSFQGLTPPIIGTINEAAHTIALSAPFGTDRTALVATFTTTGASVAIAGTPQTSGVTANNFTSPVAYIVTAGDGTTQTYVVTVTVAADNAKAITAFSLLLGAGVVGTIDEAAHTIALTVPAGTSRAALAAVFTTTGASVAVGATPQVSGLTLNDFTSPVTYTVTAADASTQAYVVTVTVAAPLFAIGDSFQGGKVAYFFAPGDTGYVAGETHGLIAAPADQNGGATIVWSNIFTSWLIGTGRAIGTGAANTKAIVGQAGCYDGAAYLCDNLGLNGYYDWYLPSQDELNQLYLNRSAIGGFDDTAVYWSSSEWDTVMACVQIWSDGRQSGNFKSTLTMVRAVRSF